MFRRYHSAHSAVEMLHDSALYKCIIDTDIDIDTRVKRLAVIQEEI